MSIKKPANALEFFRTDLRWFGVAYDEEGHVTQLTFFNESKADAERSLRRNISSVMRLYSQGSSLRSKLECYSRGGQVSFSSVSLSSRGTSFQQKVRKACQLIRYGETSTYGKIAAQAGSARAARAVGNCMKQNRVPIVVPCHRVVAAGGRIGGFSMAPGTDLKKQLLELEGVGMKFVD